MARKVGVGKVRHLELRYLWTQQQCEEGQFVLQKVPGGAKNVADMFTKACKNQVDFEIGKAAVGIQQQ